jgi:thiol-disulfide isomerase/thioredoxin
VAGCLLFFIVGSHCSPAQNTSPIFFEKRSNWEQLLKKAKRENKHIFVDAWTSWCRPCIYMNKKVFPVTGDFFNRNFINVKLQLDTSAKDDQHTRESYAMARFIRETYHVNQYPTVLFFAPSGELVHRALGAVDSAGLIDLGRRAIDPAKQLYTLKKNFEKNSADTALALTLYYAANQAGDILTAQAAADRYLAMQPDLYKPKTILLLQSLAGKPGNPAFSFFLHNEEKVDHVFGKGWTMGMLGQLVLLTRATELFYNKDFSLRSSIDWEAVAYELGKEYTTVDRGLIARLVEWLKGNYRNAVH